MNYKKNFNSPTAVPRYGFKVNLNHVYPEKRNPYVKPTLKLLWSMFPLLLRYIWYYVVCKIKKKSVVMDYFFMETAKQMYGVPIGGIGAGTIGRGFKGEFCRFQLRPNICEYNTVDANDFIVTITDKSQKTIFQSCLSTYKKKSLSKWRNLLDGEKCNYTGLFPRAWIHYDLTEYGIILECRQISPVIPHDYESSCLPCAVFVWNVKNTSSEERTVSITFTFKNGTGTKKFDRNSTCSSKSFSYQSADGVILYNNLDKMQCSYTLGVKTDAEKIKVTKCLNFDPNSDGAEIWNELYDNGQFNNSLDKLFTKTGHSFGEMGVGLAAKTKVLPETSQKIEMILVWDVPAVAFPLDDKKYYRFYTKQFGKENAALKIVDFAFQNYPIWEEKIFNWQKPILEDNDLPDWYKSALFNETYFISDGGTVWFNLDKEITDHLKDTDPRKIYGRFAYLEGHEYRMYNSYDVHFYASHALIKNWPELQKCLQYDLKDFIHLEIRDKIKDLYDGSMCERKIINTLPHDAGDPGEKPFALINAYPIHDVSSWRDIYSKFVLQTYRDAVFNRNGNIDTLYLNDMYKSCDVAMKKMLEFDIDNDGVIENSGKPDQTYDTWVMTGTSAYCGGLWLAAVYVMIKMAKILNISQDEEFFQSILANGVRSFNKKLWNGKYYNFDCSPIQSKSIMSDQLNGQWYLNCMGEGKDYPIFPEANIQSALKTIYENNVMNFCDGKMGAVNGFIDGHADEITIQSIEVWTGVTYALAATMIQEGLIDEGFKTAGGMFNSMTEKFGLIFDTPEALYAKLNYRSIAYMRPLSIWSMQIAWENYKSSSRKN